MTDGSLFKLSGASGIFAAKIDTGSDNMLLPASFSAVILKEYVVPGVRFGLVVYSKLVPLLSSKIYSLVP